MTSTAGSTRPSAEPKAVTRAAVVTHGRVEQIGSGLARLQTVAREAGVVSRLTPEEAVKHGIAPSDEEGAADLAVVLGGDGTMLRALARFLGTGIPSWGRLRTRRLSQLCRARRAETGMARVFAGGYEVVEPPIEIVIGASGTWRSTTPLSRAPCWVAWWSWNGRWVASRSAGCRVTGSFCSTPSGSTAYNLSNGGPVLVWGIDAMALTFVAPHSLHARPLVVPRGRDVLVWNRTTGVEAAVLVDGHEVGRAGTGERVDVRLAAERSLLATLPEATFVSRYREKLGR